MMESARNERGDCGDDEGNVLDGEAGGGGDVQHSLPVE